MNCFVQTPASKASNPGVRYVCTGWTGTGSVPASGTGTNVTFAITEDSTLTWNWKTQVLVSVSVTGGTGEPGSQWAEFGGTAAVELHPDPGFPVWSVSLSGDADGATVSGTTLSVPADRPREIGVAFAERKLALAVSSERGTPAPARGTSFWSWGDVVSASVAAPPEANGWQFVCTGWSGTGSVPASGTIPSVAFLIEEDSSIAWNWTTNVWIECAVTGDATSAGLAAWRAKGGAAAVVPFAAAGAPISWTITGDADGVAVNPDGGRITIPSDRPRSIAVAVTHHTTTNSVETGEPVSWSGVGAAAGWRLAPDETAVDGWSLRSGEIESGETASVEIALPHAGTLSFDWRVSSAVRKHFACCYVDGTRKARITGETDWATETVALGDGPHVVRWTYEKSSAAATGDDAAFLDNVRWAPLTLADALDAEGIEWSTEGGAAWVPQVSVSSDGEDAAKSGSLVGEETSRLVATVAGPGTLSWLWKTDVEDLAGVDVYLDGAMLDEPYLMDEPDWTAASLRIDGEGTHRLEFRFWNGGTESTIGDCAYIDCVEWNSDYVIVEGVVIPKDWIRTNAADVLAAANGNFAAAASATAANGRDKVWECYVAGVDPSDPASRFLATIGFDENGEPDVKWTPDLGGDREYVVDAKRDLDGEWGGMDADSRFFRVRVAMPGGFGAYTITFDTDGGSAVAPIAAAYGAALAAPADPEKRGFSFAGWKPVFPATMPARDQTLLALWTVNRYAIAFDTDGGSDVATLELDYGAPVTAPDEPTKQGHAFGGWMPPLPATMPASNLTVVAQWIPKRFEITFDSAGGSDVAPVSALYGEAVSEPEAPMKDGFDFAGWVPAFPATMPIGGATLVAQWTPKNYTIAFDTDDGSAVAPITAAYGSAVTAPENPTKDGYDFAGWLPAFPETMPLGGETLVAQWTPKNYTITFDTDGGSTVAAITAAYGSALTAPEPPTKDGYYFLGWVPSFPETMPLGGLTLVAQWTERVYDADWFVDAAIGNDANDGRSWNTAFATVQKAVNSSATGDKILVADGVYAPIRTENKTIEIRSEHGPANCIIDGGGTNRCAKLNKEGKDRLSDGNQSTRLVGFTLRNGRVANEAAGAYGGTLVGCILCDNHVTSRNSGGGARAAILENCLVLRNSANNGYGGGCVDCRVVNCTFAGNSANGGPGCGPGCYDCHVFNSAFVGQSSGACGTYEHNINATASDFIDAANGDYRLSAGSSCIDEGDSSKVAETTDLAGNPRIVGAAVDVGCYERQP